jgi:hypothetical protein
VTLTITHCAEDALAAGLSSQLTDRVIAERATSEWLRDLWSEKALLASQRRFVDLEGRPGAMNRTHLGLVERQRRLRVHPRHLASGRSLGGNAALAYKCVRLAATATVDGPHALLIAFDTDHKPVEERCRAGVEAARHGTTFDLAIVVAEAHPEFDGWVIAGFVPTSRRDHDAIASVRQSLRAAGFSIDPLTEPHRLTSTVSDDARDAKALCMALLGLEHQAAPDHPLVDACVQTTPLDTLLARAGDAGLNAFVDDILGAVLPLLEGRAAHA